MYDNHKLVVVKIHTRLVQAKCTFQHRVAIDKKGKEKKTKVQEMFYTYLKNKSSSENFGTLQCHKESATQTSCLLTCNNNNR